MTHDHHDHDPDHSHDHSHDHGAGDDPALDLDVPDAELNPGQLRRRGFLRGAGLLGAGIAGASVLGGAPALADEAVHGTSAGASRPAPGLRLAGRRPPHPHPVQQRRHVPGRPTRCSTPRRTAWTGWSSPTTAASRTPRSASTRSTPTSSRPASGSSDETLVFQGLEWNIPSAEHGTVFVHPGRNEVAVLKEFENTFDGVVNSTTEPARRPTRRSPSRAWTSSAASVTKRPGPGRDVPRQPPGPQGPRLAARDPRLARAPARASPSAWRARRATRRPASRRRSAPGRAAASTTTRPRPTASPAYPLESYRTWGGFDWMTATVGGLWDSLLAEGKPWWITANSDSHTVYLDDSVRPAGRTRPTSTPTAATATRCTASRRQPRPTATSGPATTAAPTSGADDFSYAAVMDGLRAGRVWVDHGGLLDGLDVQRPAKGEPHDPGVAAGRRGPGPPGPAPGAGRSRSDRRARRTGRSSCRPSPRSTSSAAPSPGRRPTGTRFHAPDTTKVVTDLRREPAQRAGVQAHLRPRPGRPRRSTCGCAAPTASASPPGINGAAVDPSGPAVGRASATADPWDDLWFYTNPIWVLPE